MSMTVIGGLYSNYAAQNVNDKAKKKEVENNSKKAEATTQNSEVKKPQLSTAAQQLLEKLQKTYNNMDFMVYGNGQDAKEILSQGTKEISVLFSSDELEKMASDEKYLMQKMQGIDGAVRMSEEINQKYGFERAFGKESTADTEITKIGIAFNDDGTTSFFAELEKSSAKQRERIEEAREEKRTEKKAADKKAEKELQSYAKSSADTKRTVVQADSMEELIKKIGAVDWENVKAEKTPENGSRFDYSI